jgi:hypothetical protein
MCTTLYPFFLNACFVCLMVFSATFNNVTAISWRPVLVVEEDSAESMAGSQEFE